MNKTLYFIRHCQSHPQSVLDQSLWPLTDRGHGQAHALAVGLGNLGLEAVYCSPYLRCVDTITPFATKAGLPINIEQDLREHLIALEVRDDFLAVWRNCWADFNFSLPGCETSHECQKRFVGSVRKIVQGENAGTIAVSSHGNTIGLFLNSIDPGFGSLQAEGLRNPDVVKIVVEGDQFIWDKAFSLEALKEYSTAYKDTPVTKSA